VGSALEELELSWAEHRGVQQPLPSPPAGTAGSSDEEGGGTEDRPTAPTERARGLARWGFIGAEDGPPMIAYLPVEMCPRPHSQTA
jgi:hypothetical protein